MATAAISSWGQVGADWGAGLKAGAHAAPESSWFSGAAETALDVLHPLTWALDIVGRPVRTFVGTGDIDRALDSIWNSDRALYGEDLLHKVGYTPFGQKPGEFELADIPDFLAETGVEIALDPLSWIGVGLPSKLGAKTASAGKTGLRALAGAEVLGEFGPSAQRAVEMTNELKKLGHESDYALEVGDSVAKWWNKKGLSTRLDTLDDVMPDWADVELAVREGVAESDDIARLAEAKLTVKTGVQEGLSNFGLGKTMAERMRRGEQSLIGSGFVFGSTTTPLFGSGQDAGVKFVEWLGDTTGVMGQVLTSTPLGRGFANAITRTKEAIWNPNPNSVFEDLLRQSGGVGAIEQRMLVEKVRGFQKRIADNGMADVSKHITDMAVYANSPGEIGVQRFQAARKAIETWAQKNGKPAVELAGDAEKFAKEFNQIQDAILRFQKSHDVKIEPLGQISRELRDEMKGLIGDHRLQEQQALDAKRVAYDEMALRQEMSGKVAQSDATKAANEWKAWEESVADIGQQNDIRRQKKYIFTPRLKEMGLDAGTRQKVLTGTDAVALHWSKQTGRPVSEWYAQVGYALTDDEILSLGRGMPVSKELKAARKELKDAESALGSKAPSTVTAKVVKTPEVEKLEAQLKRAKEALKEHEEDLAAGRGHYRETLDDDVADIDDPIDTLKGEIRDLERQLAPARATPQAVDTAFATDPEKVGKVLDAASEEDAEVLQFVIDGLKDAKTKDEADTLLSTLEGPQRKLFQKATGKKPEQVRGLFGGEVEKKGKRTVTAGGGEEAVEQVKGLTQADLELRAQEARMKVDSLEQIQVAPLVKSLPHEERRALEQFMEEIGAPMPEGMLHKEAAFKFGADSEVAQAAAKSELGIEAQIKAGIDHPALNAMRDIQKAAQEGQRAGRDHFKGLPVPKKPAPMSQRKHMVDQPWMKTLDQFREQVQKSSKGVTPSTADVARVHQRAIRKAVSDGMHVPEEVVLSHENLSKSFSREGSIFVQNEKNAIRKADSGVLSAQDWKAQVKIELDAANAAVKQSGKLAEKEYRDGFQKVYDRFQKEVVDNLPDYAKVYLTADAAEVTVRQNLQSRQRLNNSSMHRKWLDNGGRPMSPSEMNDVLTNEADRIYRVISMQGLKPEGTPGMLNAVNAAMNPDEAVYKAVAKAAGISVEKARKLPTAERLKYFKQSYAQVFEERPEVLLAASLESATSLVHQTELMKGVKNLFARPMRRIAENEESVEMLNQIKELKKSAKPKDKKVLEQLQEQYAHSGGAAVEPGWVRAGGLGEELEGMMVKGEVYRQIAGYMNNRSLPSKIKNMIPVLAKTVGLWKAVQLTWPGTMVRDWLGNVFLRIQHDGLSRQTFRDMGALRNLVKTAGDPEKLGKLSGFTLAGKKYTAEEFWSLAVREGVLGKDIISQEIKGTLRDSVKGQRGIAGRAFQKVTDVPKKMNDWERLQMFHARLAKGDTVEDASAKTIAALYDYSRVSPAIEFLRTTGAVPFATWLSKNIPHQFELLATKPGQFAALVHAKNAVENGVPGVAESELPSYVRDKFNITWGRDKDGKLWFNTLTGVIPAADIWENGLDILAQALGPIPKSLVEQAANVDLFTQRTIKEFDGQYGIMDFGVGEVKVPVRGKQLLKTVVGRPLTLAEGLGEVVSGQIDPKTGKAKSFWDKGGLVSAMFGVAPKRTDALRNAMNEVSDMQREIRAIKGAAGRFGRRGNLEAEQELLQKAHKLEELLQTGRLAPAGQVLQAEKMQRSRETDERRRAMETPSATAW